MYSLDDVWNWLEINKIARYLLINKNIMVSLLFQWDVPGKSNPLKMYCNVM